MHPTTRRDRVACVRPSVRPPVGAACWWRRLGLGAAGAVSVAVGALGGMQVLDPSWIERAPTASLAGLLGMVVLPAVTWWAWRCDRLRTRRAASRRTVAADAQAEATRAEAWARRSLEKAAARAAAASAPCARTALHTPTRPASLEIAHRAMAETRRQLIGEPEPAHGSAPAGRRHRRSTPAHEARAVRDTVEHADSPGNEAAGEPGAPRASIGAA